MDEKLYRKYEEVLLWNIRDMEPDEARYWLENDAIPEAGGVTGLITNWEMRKHFCNEIDELFPIWKEFVGDKAPENFAHMVWLGWNVFKGKCDIESYIADNRT